jgi:hypothetical protein
MPSDNRALILACHKTRCAFRENASTATEENAILMAHSRRHLEESRRLLARTAQQATGYHGEIRGDTYHPDAATLPQPRSESRFGESVNAQAAGA